MWVATRKAAIRIAHSSVPTQERLKELFEYEAKTGCLINRFNRSSLSRKGEVAGSVGDRYHVIRIDGKLYVAHRLIWVWHNKFLPDEFEIDHIDHNTKNNRIENLRVTDRWGNLRNKSLQSNNTTGTPGIEYDSRSKRWRARCMIGGKNRHLGSFDTKAEAIAARKVGERLAGYHKNHGLPRYNDAR